MVDDDDYVAVGGHFGPAICAVIPNIITDVDQVKTVDKHESSRIYISIYKMYILSVFSILKY